MMNDRSVSGLLLSWYDENKRILPWRDIHDPYATWVSETMLQQTRVETVLSYYNRFLSAFPDVRTLAEAEPEAVMKLWEGLGYYSRARNLQKGARQVMESFGGVIPKTPEELLTICGIGEYTAGAIASIAYGIPVPAVDGNTVRVISRVAGIRDNTALPGVRREIAAKTAEFLPEDRPGDFNQAVMDLGSGICTPGTPSCEGCPLTAVCNAFAAGDAEQLPIIPRKKPPRPIDYDVLILLSSDHRVLVRRRTENMLQGLWAFPMVEGHRQPEALTAAFRRLLHLDPGSPGYLQDARHIFTHQIWQMKLYSGRTDTAEAPEGWRFITREELEALPFPTALSAARKAAVNALDREP